MALCSGCAQVLYVYEGCAPGRWEALNDATTRRCHQLGDQLADAACRRREAVVFSDSQVLNLLLWGFVVALFALGYIAGRLR